MLLPGLLRATLASSPLEALDVGAAGGIPAYWEPYLDVMSVAAFEPDQTECARQQARSSPAITWFPVALAGSDGLRQLFVLRRSTGSSLLSPNEEVLGKYSMPDYYGVRTLADVRCRSLDSFLRTTGRNTPHLLKLDTQGTELEILSSLGDERWKEVLAVEVEVEFAELYNGQPLFADVDAFAVGKGLQLFDLRTHRAYRSGPTGERHYLRSEMNTAVGTRRLSAQLVAGDALYLRQPEDPTVYRDRATLARYLLILLAYRYHDLVFYVLDGEPAGKLLDDAEIEGLRSDVAAAAPRPSPLQRTGVVPALARRVLAKALDGRQGHVTFWTRRQWPDQ